MADVPDLRSPVESPRLSLRAMRDADAAFLVELYNDPDFVRFIGDRGVGDEAGAKSYLAESRAARLDEHGLGLRVIEMRSDGTAVGVCGLLQREALDLPDLGFALLPAFRGAGIAFEASAAMLRWGGVRLGLRRVAAIVLAGNSGSIALLRKLGFARDGELEMDAERLELYVRSEPGPG